jgi:hypothetical protein
MGMGIPFIGELAHANHYTFLAILLLALATSLPSGVLLVA